MKVPMAISHGRGRSSVGAGAEVINAFAQRAPQGAKDQVFLVGCPGTSYFSSTETTTERVLAFQPAFDKMVMFSTGGIYIVDANGTSTRIGDPIAGPISTAYNGSVVVAVNGEVGIVVDEHGSEAITDPDFLPATTVQFILGFFVFTRADSGQYFISEIYSTDFDALDFATAESAPDDLVAVVAVRREIWLLGKDTVEVHGATTGGFPFIALPGVSIDYGCVAPFSALAIDQSVFWFSPDGIVYQSSGYGAQRVSEHEIEEELSLVRADWPNAYAWSYIEDGHLFYVLTVGEQTFVFDLATRLWHKRQSAGLTRHLANCACTTFGKTLVGDDQGRVLELSLRNTEDLVGDIVIVIGSGAYAPREFFTTASFGIEAEVGQGAEATLEYSDDTDGKTWSNRLPVSLGALGEHTTFVEWRRLGRARSKRFRVRLYGPGKKRIGSMADLVAA